MSRPVAKDFRRWSIRRVLLPILCVVISGVALGPTWVTIIWHLRHGNTVACVNHRIQVPLGWYASLEPRSVTLLRFAPTVFTERIIRASIYMAPLEYQPQSRAEIEQVYENFEKAFWTKLVPADNTIEGPMRLGTGSDESFCMRSFSLKKDQSPLRESCIVFQGTWRADFSGEKEDRETFHLLVTAPAKP